MSVKILHPVRLALYATLSAADLLLTYQLIQQGNGDVYESNPIAEAWLSLYGWTGLVIYKVTIVLVVGVVASFVSLSRPRTGGHLLTFACLAGAAVVTYSIYVSRFIDEIPPYFPENQVANYPSSFRRARGYGLIRPDECTNLLGELKDGLIRQPYSLSGAVKKLAQTERAKSPEWMAELRGRYPGHSDEVCLAAYLVNHTIGSLTPDQSRSAEIVEGLKGEFLTCYGTQVPGLSLGMWVPGPSE